jgi:PhoH-like ATPase
MTRYSKNMGQMKGPHKPKIFVLDTNIILHDHNAIHKFQDNDLVIPIAVIEELDKFKKGNDTLGYNARGFMRDIDKLTDGRTFGENGISLGKGLGNIKVEPNHPFAPEYKDLFKDDIQDHRILATSMWVRDNNPDRFVALVTKDINLRMKAKAAGMEVEDYLTDRVEEARIEYAQQEVQFLKLNNEDFQKLVYGPDNAISWKGIVPKEPDANQRYKIRKDDVVYCARYDTDIDKIVLVKTVTAFGIKPRNDEQKFAIDACLNKKIPLVSLTGGAGTGKTLIALACAMEQAEYYDQIIITRPVIVMGNQDIGFLPGDQNKKMSPFLQPLMDNLNVIKSQYRPGSKESQRIDEMVKSEKLVITPLAYIRGRSLGNAYCIVDEAQNLTPNEIKTVITRAGEGTKMVFTGDVFQIDQPYLDQWSNGLTHLGEKLDNQRLFEHVFLRKGERSALSDLAAKLL